MTGTPRARWRRVSVVLQATATDCGPACLTMVLRSAGAALTLDAVREDMGVGRDGVTAYDLRAEARRHGLDCKAVRTGIEGLRSLPLPLIAHWEDNHFLVVERVGRRTVSVVDPAIGRRTFTPAEFGQGYRDIALAFRGSPAAAAATPGEPPLAAESVWRGMIRPALAAHRRVLAALLLTSALLLVAGLAVPIVTAAIVGAVASGTAAGSGAGWVAVVAVVTAAVGVIALIRGLAGAHLQRIVGGALPRDLLERLLAAPLRFFDHRGTGEIVSRLTATDVVRDALATRLVGAVLDAVLATVYLVLLAVIDPRLALITVCLAAVQLVVVGALAVRGRRLRREELLAEARSTSWLVESVRGMEWVKAAGAEGMLRRRWADLHGRRLIALSRASRTIAMAEAVADAFRIGGPVALLLAAVPAATGPALPLVGTGPGAVVGLAALGAAVLLPLGSLAGHLRAISELGSVVEHLTDLAQAPAEQPPSRPSAPPLRGGIALRAVSFRHTHRSAWILRDISVQIPAGGKLAIVGASGSGKSTLAKLICGLYEPTEGVVLIDGTPLQSFDLPSVRRQMGVVLQDPFLLSGTVADAIALRSPAAPLPAIREAARLAGVHDEILDLPRGYQTWLAEGGSGLSGGQRQRLALARALLDKPAVLVLDEATSHLDATTEAVVETNLHQLGMTRIVVAHRLSTVQDADHVLVLDAGRVVEQGSPSQLSASGGRYAALAAAQQPANL
ncbi:peptidase domain-containing ABC transporter [Nakamurella sp. GG22]